MENTAKLIFEGKEYEFPIVVGTENEKAINIEKLRALTGLVTLDSGYKNTGSCKSAITFLDGEKGILRYRGYNIEELAAKAEFLEVAYLLIFGELPTAEEYDDFKKTIHKYTLVHEDMRRIMDGFPRSAHPMGVLASATSALTAFNPVPVNVHCPKRLSSGLQSHCQSNDYRFLGVPQARRFTAELLRQQERLYREYLAPLL